MAVTESLLNGMRVVEFGSYVAVPLGGMTIAALGADVIRIDPVGGASDVNRAPLDRSGRSIYWASLNKGKRSVMLDLRSEEGKEIAEAIATQPGPDAGFFVSNAIGGGWHSDAALRARRHDLIWVRLQGLADGRPALDYTVNWEVGFSAATGPGDSQSPTLHALPAWDLLAGMHIALSLVAAERRRTRTAQGSSITLSLMDVALWSTDALGIFAEVQLLGAGRERTGDFVHGTFGTHFVTADGRRIMLVALTKRQWNDLVNVTGLGHEVARVEAETGEDLADEHARWRQRQRIRDLLDPWFAARTEEEIESQFSTTRLVWSALKTFEEAAQAPFVTVNPLFHSVTHDELGAFRAMTYPAIFGDEFESRSPVAPSLGAHTEEVLGEVLGLTAREVGALIDRGVAAGCR